MRRAIAMCSLLVTFMVALGGCSVISDFDFTFSDEDAGPPGMDAGDSDAGEPFDAGDVDAGEPFDAGDSDGGPGGARCPAPCLGDAVEEFDTTPGGGSLMWRYHEDRRALAGLIYPDLSYDASGQLVGYQNGSGAVVVASCADNATEPECAGIPDYLYVAGDAPGTGADPVIGFTATSRAVLRIQGRVRLPDGVSTAETHRVSISRNARYDAAAVQRFVPTTAPMDLDFLVDVLPGDGILVRFDQTTGGTPLQLGVQLWVTRMGTPLEDRCQIGLPFEPPNALRDICGDYDVENLNDGITGPGGTSTSGMGPSSRLGDARTFDEGQYLVVGQSAVDYSGDFTVSLWGNVSSASRFDHSLWADSTSDSPPGGVSMSMTGTVGYARTFFPQGLIACTEARPGVCVAGGSLGAVGNDEWHYWRLVREGGQITVCIDGAERLRLTVPATHDLTGPYRPYVARNVTFNPAYFQGSIDDVRVYDVALPCEL